MAQSQTHLLPAKKQIQACLPFKPLNTVCTPQATSGLSTKKRRLPDATSLGCHRSAKNLKTEENQHEASKELNCSDVDIKEEHWEKNEKERFRLMEKEKRENKKLEAKLLKECERIEKEKEKAEKKKLKEDERLQKLEQLQQEKRRKEEARLDEKKKKDEKKEKQEDKVTKEKELMQRFFKTSNKGEIFNHKPQDVKAVGPFMDFEVKENMRLAPGSRISFGGTEACRQLDEHLINQNVDVLYLEELKSGLFKPHTSGPTWPLIELDVSILPAAGSSLCCMRAKLLQFHENYRPAYYGTWRKHSRVIHARHPLCRDRDLLDYDVDSDDEWEEEEPGESLSHSENEDEDDTEADVDDEGDGFFVPHGYLSDGEGCDGDDDDSEHQICLDKRKAQQLATASKWEVEMNKTSNILQPLVIGIHWCLTENTDLHESDPLFNILQNFKAFLLDSPPFITSYSDVESAINSSRKCDAVDKNAKSCLNMPFPEMALPDLARLVHGNEWSIKKLVCEFCEFWRQKTTSESGQDDVERMSTISKRQLRDKIREMAVYELRAQCCKRKLWYVNTDVLTALNLSDLPVRTQWQWITPIMKKSGTQQAANSVAGSQHSSIKSFMTKKLSSGIATLAVPPLQQCSPGIQDAVKDLQVAQKPVQYEAMQHAKQSSELFSIQQFDSPVTQLNVADNANIACSSSPAFPLVGNPLIELAPQQLFAPNQHLTGSCDDCIIID